MVPTIADVLALEPVRRGAPKVLAGQGRWPRRFAGCT